MITNIKDKNVNVTWKENQTVQTMKVRAIDLMNDWICLQNLEKENGSVFWARMDDIDVIEVLDADYEPSSPNDFLGVGGEMPNIFPGVTRQDDSEKDGASFMKVAMEFLLPQAASDYYMANHAQNAFSAIYKIMMMIDAAIAESKRGKKAEASSSLKKIKEGAHLILKEFQIDFDDEEDNNDRKGGRNEDISLRPEK